MTDKILYVSSVIRASLFGYSTGYLYKIDLDSGEILDKYDWNGSYEGIMNNERGGERGVRGLEIYNNKLYAAVNRGILEFDLDLNLLRQELDKRFLAGLHEICEFQDKLYVTSTGYDGIAEMDFETLKVEKLWVFNKIMQKSRFLLHNRPRQKDQFHINSISAFADRLVYGSSKMKGHLDFFGQKEIHAHQRPKGAFKHNTYEYEDCYVSLITNKEEFYYFNKETGEHKYITVKFSDHDTYESTEKESLAKYNWLRGLERLDEDRFIVGSSPARIGILNVKTGELEREIFFSEDVKNCIHGIKLFTKDDE